MQFSREARPVSWGEGRALLQQQEGEEGAGVGLGPEEREGRGGVETQDQSRGGKRWDTLGNVGSGEGPEMSQKCPVPRLGEGQFLGAGVDAWCPPWGCSATA